MDITNPQHSFLQTSTTGITNALLVTHPNTQAIYLYGTWGSEYFGNDAMKIVEI